MREQMQVARNAFEYLLREAQPRVFRALCPHTRTLRLVEWIAISAGFAHEYKGPMRAKKECFACRKVIQDAPASKALENRVIASLSESDPIFMRAGDSIRIGTDQRFV